MADGYHAIETLFAFAEDGDRLSVAADDDLSLTIAGPFAGGLSRGADNLVLRAAAALQARFGVNEGAALHLDKRLPVASGIGGGSADAAATLRLLARHWRLATVGGEIEAIARSLGADVAACILSTSARGSGRGDDLAPVDGERLSGMPMLLINPGLPLATGPVFAGWDGVDRGALAGGDPLDAALAGRNDLQSPAIGLCPAIGDVLGWIAHQPGVIVARMSGSGATCFALFDHGDARDAAGGSARARFPGGWCLETTLR